VKPEQGQDHIAGAVRRFQGGEKFPHLIHQIRPDSAAVVFLIQPFKPFVFYVLDHAPFLPVSTVSSQYTSGIRMSIEPGFALQLKTPFAF
jgi:hypothetical protein